MERKRQKDRAKRHSETPEARKARLDRRKELYALKIADDNVVKMNWVNIDSRMMEMVQGDHDEDTVEINGIEMFQVFLAQHQEELQDGGLEALELLLGMQSE